MIEISAPKIKDLEEGLEKKKKEEAEALEKERLEAEEKKKESKLQGKDVDISDMESVAGDKEASGDQDESNSGRYFLIGAGIALIAGLGYTLMKKSGPK